MSLFFAFLAFFGWGTGDIFGTIATRKIGAFSTTIWFSLFQFLIFIIFAPFFWNELQNLTLSLLAINLVLGLVAVLATTTFYEALRTTSASLAGTIIGSFAALTIILSLVFLGESINSKQIAAICVIFFGIIVSSLNFKELTNQKILTSHGVRMSLGSMFFWGVYWAFIKVPVSEVGWYWPIIFSLMMYPTILVFMKFRKIRLQKPYSLKLLGILVLNSTILGIGSFGYNLGIERDLVAIVAPIAGAYSVLFAILAYLVFKDKLSKQQIFGIVITLVGIIFLSYFSV